MTIFKSTRNNVTVGFLWLVVVFLIVIPFFPENKNETSASIAVGFVVLYSVCGMLIWMLLDTNYKIKSNRLFYCSGPVRGSIEINTIRKIERWNKWYVMSFIKPALDKDGLIVYYKKFDDLFISPENKEDFIAALREINPDIEVV